MKSSRTSIQVIIFLAIAIAGVWLGMRAGGDKPAAPPVVSGNQPTAPGGNPVSPPESDQSPKAVLQRIFQRIRSGSMAEGELDRFRAALLAANPDESIAAIKAFLASGQDALTGERFTVGAGGKLEGAPTFRVLLLDMLGRISNEHGRADGAAVARALMEKKTSADEWAIALRNVGWATPGDHKYLASKTRELIGYQPWRMQPSAGYFEAFDVIVYTRDVSFIPDLAGLVRAEDKPVKNTAATTLDRLAGMAPLGVMSYLNANPVELSDKPFLRSDYYAKADLTQPAERAAVEAYLARKDVDPRAREKVIAGLGNPGVFVSENLLTSTPAPAEEMPPPQKAALITAFNDWIKAGRYPELNATVAGRLGQLQGE